ncbi:protein ORF76 [Anguillid herpesvirus 1]|uniref:Protein ORF76 n=1 Tax=Anguillid herpesvirus 1 TaxID=150286 RepID=A0A1J0REI9_9VIRU|nr:protein ORF76 [Anguillid herpesvirus 1]ADA57839.1 protein ORF76 [Anguillid herpesvirus 1]APD76238.1 ORF76 [Anguillid herpesvirus 1]QRM16369.1 protein ORF76 [Anguillid herpesvirus 1]QRM16628.1 protein ORF76 [Anguillid herpesvirus 1]QRM16761.1 protein ORF76 [Anguillid herpesvirus 1]
MKTVVAALLFLNYVASALGYGRMFVSDGIGNQHKWVEGEKNGCSCGNTTSTPSADDFNGWGVMKKVPWPIPAGYQGFDIEGNLCRCYEQLGTWKCNLRGAQVDCHRFGLDLTGNECAKWGLGEHGWFCYHAISGRDKTLSTVKNRRRRAAGGAAAAAGDAIKQGADQMLRVIVGEQSVGQALENISPWFGSAHRYFSGDWGYTHGPLCWCGNQLNICVPKYFVENGLKSGVVDRQKGDKCPAKPRNQFALDSFPPKLDHTKIYTKMDGKLVEGDAVERKLECKFV